LSNLKKWALPAIEIAANSFISFDEITGFHNPISEGFGLDKAGEQVFLSFLPGTSDDQIVDSIRFKGQENNTSLARYPDGGQYWFKMTPSQDSANTDPMSDVLINEIMYHPENMNDEYIELYNPTPEQINLENVEGQWRLDGGVDFVFPAGLSIAAYGRLMVVGFDPSIETARLDALITTYNSETLIPDIDIVGPWSGNLSNAGERIALERPQEPDQLGELPSWVIVDEVIYSDVPPWPEAADGTGSALQRISSTQFFSGNDPDNWSSASPTPGFEP
jgi:hypothetical protein